MMPFTPSQCIVHQARHPIPKLNSTYQHSCPATRGTTGSAVRSMNMIENLFHSSAVIPNSVAALDAPRLHINSMLSLESQSLTPDDLHTHGGSLGRDPCLLSVITDALLHLLPLDQVTCPTFCGPLRMLEKLTDVRYV